MSSTNGSPNPGARMMPVLPLKNTVLFPYLFIPLSVGRSSSRAAVEAALATEDKAIAVFAQRDQSIDQPGGDDLYAIGTQAIIKKMVRTEEGIEVLVQGVERVRLQKIEQTEPYLHGQIEPFPLPTDQSTEIEAHYRTVLEQAKKVIELTQPDATVNVQQLAAQTAGPLHLAFLISSMLGMELEKEQALLEAKSIEDALRMIGNSLAHEVQVLELRNQIATRAQSEMSKEQREYMLRHQMQAIQDELGDVNPEKAETNLLRESLEKASLPEEIRKEADRELRRLERIPAASPENQLTRNYLELLLELPWSKSSPDRLELPYAQQVLDEDHYNLKEIKERILEHLAVMKLNPNAKAPILCFVGPPGVGKTSLGQSIARAMDRKFERVSLGGLHDEAELRGHRRTYIGAMPGRIIQALRRAGVNNPVVLLDEVDKLGHDFRGDPAAALMEILDPAQNNTFRDNYLDLPFVLSKVFFIATANTLDTIPRALLDRLEILQLSGYSEEEKVEIARRYIVPRQLSQAGLSEQQLILPDETIAQVISSYTREAGLRQLEKAIGRIARKVAVRFAEGKNEPMTIHPDDLIDYLGTERMPLERLRKELPPGVATGLAWTEAGGEVLYVEASQLPGAASLRLTGQLGDVMRESAKIAQSFVTSHADMLGISPRVFRRGGVHLHVPAGAVPKDGPSAGIAMVTALASLYTQTPVPSDLAMTGEITLTGLVLPIGGVKEKVLAARRAGIHRIIIPKENEKDLRDLPEQVREEMNFVLAERIEDVLAAAIPNVMHAMI